VTENSTLSRRERRREAWRDWIFVTLVVHASLAVLAFHSQMTLVQVPATLMLACGFAMGGVTSLHHAAHRRFGRRWLTNILAVHTSAPTGFWVRQWATKHQIHHRRLAAYPDDPFTNIGGGILRFHLSAPVRPWHRYQLAYAWLLYVSSWEADILSQGRYLLAEVLSSDSYIAKTRSILSYTFEKFLEIGRASCRERV